LPIPSVLLSTHAMATRFEILLYGEDPVRLRAAGDEVIAEIERLDRQLSFYRPESDVSWINAYASSGPVRIDPRIFSLLSLSVELNEKTYGAFDIAIGSLLQAWGFTGGKGHFPRRSAIESAQEQSGVKHLRLDRASSTVAFDRPGVKIDLGAIGKGYAIEQAIELLQGIGIKNALIHGGTSTSYGLGCQPDGRPWRIAVRSPTNSKQILEVLELADSSLSVSATHGKYFVHDGVTYGHVIDPRTGFPVQGQRTAFVVGPSPTICDALSTGLLVLGKEGMELLETTFPAYKCVVVSL